MAKIKNFDALAVSDARRDLLAIADAGLEAIDTGRVMRENLALSGADLRVGGESVDLAKIKDLVLIAVGKCAADAAAVAEEVLGDRITRGVVADVKVCPVMRRLQTFCGTHPLPSAENLRAAEAIVESLKGLSDQDLVIFIISGGGSTLLFLPEDPENREETAIFTALTDVGATIEELNVVRRHLSFARGGFLAKDAYPAKVVSLIFSDVPGNDIAAIASGPTVKDATTMEDAVGILEKFGVDKTCPIARCGLIETPKEDKYFERVTNALIVSNERALAAMKQEAERRGFAAEIKTLTLAGEAADVAAMAAGAIHAAAPKSVLLWGGETTVTVRGTGSGGRNLTVCAAALGDVRDGEEILSLASDGRDHGPWAGAICDTMTKKAAADAGADVERALTANDTYPLFEKIGNYLDTGDTGSNVSDLIIALKI